MNLTNQTRNDVVPYYAAVIRDDEARKALEADPKVLRSMKGVWWALGRIFKA